MMLRIDSLTSEKKYLINENNVSKRNIETVIILYYYIMYIINCLFIYYYF